MRKVKYELPTIRVSLGLAIYLGKEDSLQTLRASFLPTNSMEVKMVYCKEKIMQRVVLKANVGTTRQSPHLVIHITKGTKTFFTFWSEGFCNFEVLLKNALNKR